MSSSLQEPISRLVSRRVRPRGGGADEVDRKAEDLDAPSDTPEPDVEVDEDAMAAPAAVAYFDQEDW